MALTLSQTLAELEKLGHRPNKNLGQNYLIDGNIVAKSLELADVSVGDHIVEVGPGLGTLSRSLLENGARVWAVEYDARMAGYLRDEIGPTWSESFQLLEADAVKHPRAGLPDEEARQGFKVVANLPYAISTPWQASILRYPLPTHMVLMLQRETADRFSAKPGTKQFGAISIWLQSAYDILPGHRVSPTCFYPPPEVDSYLLNLRLKPTPFVYGDLSKELIRQCFQQRRKQIGSLVRKVAHEQASAWVDTLQEYGASHKSRPEDVPLGAWQRLATMVDSPTAA